MPDAVETVEAGTVSKKVAQEVQDSLDPLLVYGIPDSGKIVMFPIPDDRVYVARTAPPKLERKVTNHHSTYWRDLVSKS